MKMLALFAVFIFFGCQSDEKAKNELWIYTSMYKDTIADLTPKLKKDFPDVEFKWFQAGSENVASKVNAELMANRVQADVVICSDRFWYEEMAKKDKLLTYRAQKFNEVPEDLRHPEGKYSTVSIPVMVLSYNKEALAGKSAPKTFKELTGPEWKDMFTTGSPLASGTNFTTMAMIQHHYGWEYFEKLKKNGTIAQGGNSAVVRRIQNKERPIGWVLLENLLRFQGKDERLQIVYPEDGVVTHTNVMAILKDSDNSEMAKKFVDWMYKKEGQEAMTRSYMYSPLSSIAPPMGAPPLQKILANSFKWTRDLIEDITSKRSLLKEKYTEIMFQ